LGIRISGNLRIGKESGKESVSSAQKFNFRLRQSLRSQKFLRIFPNDSGPFPSHSKEKAKIILTLSTAAPSLNP
jgi:hypothetical protein